MKKSMLLMFLFIILLTGCQDTEIPVVATKAPTPITTSEQSSTPVPTQQATLTSVLPSSTANILPTETDKPTRTETAKATSVATIPLETRLELQCLDIAPASSSDVTSSGIIVFESRVSDGGRYKADTYLHDMATGQSTQLAEQNERLGRFVISPDKKFMAFSSAVVDAEDKIIQKELVIADVDGQRKQSIPWEDQWLDILGWTNNQRLLIAYDEPVTSSDGSQSLISYLVLDPFTDEQQILNPNFPSFLDLTLAWGWQGVIYDSALTRGVYARFIDSNEETYTFGLWDLEKQQLVNSLEDIYANFTVTKETSPIPNWSPDGSRFVFKGGVLISEEPVVFELYQVSRDGQIEQLTQLTSYISVQHMNLSWSPNGRYIAMFLNDWSEMDDTRVALLNIETLKITDYCIPVRGIMVPPAIWSPDGNQFLVVDQYEDDHQRVILVDLDQGYAAIIAEDMEPVGWMVASQE